MGDGLPKQNKYTYIVYEECVRLLARDYTQTRKHTQFAGNIHENTLGDRFENKSHIIYIQNNFIDIANDSPNVSDENFALKINVSQGLNFP